MIAILIFWLQLKDNAYNVIVYDLLKFLNNSYMVPNNMALFVLIIYERKNYITTKKHFKIIKNYNNLFAYKTLKKLTYYNKYVNFFESIKDGKTTITAIITYILITNCSYIL